MTGIVSMSYSSVRRGISLQIEKKAGLIDQLNKMGITLPKELTISLLIASIEALELAPVTAAMKTLTGGKVEWETVANRLVEEHRDFNSKLPKKERTNAVSTNHKSPDCAICDRDRHST